jgi:hypothetical protein
MKSAREVYIDTIEYAFNKAYNPYRDKLGRFATGGGSSKITAMTDEKLDSEYSKALKKKSELGDFFFSDKEYKKRIKENPDKYSKLLELDKQIKQISTEKDKRKNQSVEKILTIGNKDIKYRQFNDGRIEYADKKYQEVDSRYTEYEGIWKQMPTTKNMDDLVSFARTKDGKVITQVRLQAAKDSYKNFKNGNVTLYRGGIMRQGYNATSLDKKIAEGFGRYGYGNIPTVGLGVGKTSETPMSKLYEIKVNEKNILAFSFNEAEAIINSGNIISQKEIRYSK